VAIQVSHPPVPISSPITGPINLGQHTGEMLLTGKVDPTCEGSCHSTSTAVAYDAPWLVLALLGALALWWRRRRGLLGCVLATLAGGFLLPMIARTYVAERFALYLLPAYALLAAIGIGTIVTEATRRRIVSKAALASVALVLLIYGVLQMNAINEHWNQHPPVDYRGMADAFVGSGIAHAITNAPPNVSDGITYYLGDKVSYAGPEALKRDLCSTSAPFAFIQLSIAITPVERDCLLEDHASAMDFHGGGNDLLRLWLVQAPGLKRFGPRVIGKPNARRQHAGG
jgi:MYXO-CTERM domain-containing protein